MWSSSLVWPTVLAGIARPSLVIVALGPALSTPGLVPVDGRDGLQQRPCGGVIQLYLLHGGHWRCCLLDIKQGQHLTILDERDAIEVAECRQRLGAQEHGRSAAGYRRLQPQAD